MSGLQDAVRKTEANLAEWDDLVRAGAVSANLRQRISDEALRLDRLRANMAPEAREIDHLIGRLVLLNMDVAARLR